MCSKSSSLRLAQAQQCVVTRLVPLQHIVGLARISTAITTHGNQCLSAAAHELKGHAAGFLLRAGTAVTAPFASVSNSRIADQAPVGSAPYLKLCLHLLLPWVVVESQVSVRLQVPHIMHISNTALCPPPDLRCMPGSVIYLPHHPDCS